MLLALNVKTCVIRNDKLIWYLPHIISMYQICFFFYHLELIFYIPCQYYFAVVFLFMLYKISKQLAGLIHSQSWASKYCITDLLGFKTLCSEVKSNMWKVKKQ